MERKRTTAREQRNAAERERTGEVHTAPVVQQHLMGEPTLIEMEEISMEEVALIEARAQAAAKDMRAKALAAGNWSGYVFSYPRPYRRDGFSLIRDRLSDSEYWKLLREMWIDTELPNLHRQRGYWLGLFKLSRENRSELMTPNEHEALATLPDPVRIYRGAAPKYARGLSWTTDPERAKWFAERYSAWSGRVFTCVIPKTKILAYFLERDENEVVIDPSRVHYQPLDVAG